MKIKELIKKLAAKKAEAAARPQAGARFGVSWPLLIAVCLVLVCAVAWAFFMGLMVGRGQSPHAEVEAMTGLSMPAPRAKAPGELPLVAEDQASAIAEGAMPAIGAAVEQAAVERQAGPRPAPRPAAKPAPARKAKPADSGQRYDYTFQAGAFKSLAEARGAESRLSKKGIKARTSRSGKVWLVLVSLRGGSDDVAKLRQTMKALKMGEPLRLSRKPAGRPGRGNG